MADPRFPGSRTRRRIDAHPERAHHVAFVERLRRDGYMRDAAQGKLVCAIRFLAWLRRRGVAVRYPSGGPHLA